MSKRKRPATPPKDLMLAALHAIRREMQGMREEQRKTNERLDQTVGRLDATVDRLDRLERRVTEGFIETNTKLADLSRHVDERIDLLGNRLENVFKGQMGQDVRDLKERVRALESQALHEKHPPYPDKK